MRNRSPKPLAEPHIPTPPGPGDEPATALRPQWRSSPAPPRVKPRLRMLLTLVRSTQRTPDRDRSRRHVAHPRESDVPEEDVHPIRKSDREAAHADRVEMPWRQLSATDQPEAY